MYYVVTKEIVVQHAMAAPKTARLGFQFLHHDNLSEVILDDVRFCSTSSSSFQLFSQDDQKNLFAYVFVELVHSGNG